MKCVSSYKTFHSWNCIWKCHLWNGGHFVQGEMSKCSIHQLQLYIYHITPYKEGILPKGPYLPCVSMAGRALLAGYHRINLGHISWMSIHKCFFPFESFILLCFKKILLDENLLEAILLNVIEKWFNLGFYCESYGKQLILYMPITDSIELRNLDLWVFPSWMKHFYNSWES